jgi:hypothetical protein
MSVEVVISEEGARGCGFRKPAKDGVGVYLVGPSDGSPCGRLPFALHACPVCSQGIKAGRGWQWIEPSKLFAPPPGGALFRPGPGSCSLTIVECSRCPLGAVPQGKHGLIWIGGSYYSNAAAHAKAHQMGISRKINRAQRFPNSATIVYLAHHSVVDTGAKDENDKPKLGPCVHRVQ